MAFLDLCNVEKVIPCGLFVIITWFYGHDLAMGSSMLHCLLRVLSVLWVLILGNCHFGTVCLLHGFAVVKFLFPLAWVFLDGKTFKKPRRPYEKERLDAELKLVGEYGLRCKRELWRVQYALSRIRNNARMLLTLDEKNPRRIFEGEALLRRMNRYGLLEENQNKLDYVLALTVENFLERRLQTLVFKSGMAKSIHHARVLIRQRHIRYLLPLVHFSL